MGFFGVRNTKFCVQDIKQPTEGVRCKAPSTATSPPKAVSDTSRGSACQGSSKGSDKIIIAVFGHGAPGTRCNRSVLLFWLLSKLFPLVSKQQYLPLPSLPAGGSLPLTPSTWAGSRQSPRCPWGQWGVSREQSTGSWCSAKRSEFSATD